MDAIVVDGLEKEREDRRVPVILFTKGGGAWLDIQAATGADALGVDWTTDLAEARDLRPERQTNGGSGKHAEQNSRRW